MLSIAGQCPYFVVDPLPYLLVHENRDVCMEAAKLTWQLDDAGITAIFNVLSSRGMIPSGIEAQKGRRAAEILRDCCPPERRKLFEQLAVDRFGPSIAGHENEKSQGEVTFKEVITKPGKLGGVCTYEVYTSKKKLDALRFLENKEVTKKSYFVEVETPEGNWGKDYFGIYEW